VVKEEEGVGVDFPQDKEEEENEEEGEAASEAEAAAGEGEAEGKEAVAVVVGEGALAGGEEEASAWSALRVASDGRAVIRLPKVSWRVGMNGGRQGSMGPEEVAGARPSRQERRMRSR